MELDDDILRVAHPSALLKSTLLGGDLIAYCSLAIYREVHGRPHGASDIWVTPSQLLQHVRAYGTR